MMDSKRAAGDGIHRLTTVDVWGNHLEVNTVAQMKRGPDAWLKKKILKKIFGYEARCGFW